MSRSNHRAMMASNATDTQSETQTQTQSEAQSENQTQMPTQQEIGHDVLTHNEHESQNESPAPTEGAITTTASTMASSSETEPESKKETLKTLSQTAETQLTSPARPHKDPEEPDFSSPAAAVLQHITKVKLEMQEKIYALKFQMKQLTQQNTEKAAQLAQLDARIQAQEVGSLCLSLSVSVFLWLCVSVSLCLSASLSICLSVSPDSVSLGSLPF